MNFQRLALRQVPSGIEWLALALLSLGASLLGIFIHSAFVFARGFRLDGAEIGGAYFGNMDLVRDVTLEVALGRVGLCGIPAVFTFLALLPVRNRQKRRWVVWACAVILSTIVYSNLEPAATK